MVLIFIMGVHTKIFRMDALIVHDKNFQEWMHENNPDVIEKVDEIYGFCDEEWWSDFEKSISLFGCY